MANSMETHLDGTMGVAARALESFTRAVSDDIPEMLSPSQSTNQNKDREMVTHSPVVNSPAVEEGMSALKISGEEEECRTDEESLSAVTEVKRKNNKIPCGETDCLKRLQVPDRDEGSSTDVESLSGVEEMEQDYRPVKDVSASRPKLEKRQITLLAEETLVDTASAVASETEEETFLLQESENLPDHLNLPQMVGHKTLGNQRRPGQRLGHRRQRSSSQPTTPLREEGGLSPMSIKSDRECLHNLSSHVTAVFRNRNSFPAARPLGKIKKPSVNECPQARTSMRVDKKTYYLYNAADRERLLRTLLIEDDAGRLASPSGTANTLTDTLAVDAGDLESEEEASGVGTDTEEVSMDLPMSVFEEWTETDPDTGDVRRVVCKTTHTTVSSAKPAENGGRWTESEGYDQSGQPITSRVVTTRTTRMVGPDGQEQVITTTTTSGGEDVDEHMRRSMQGVLENFMTDQAPTRGSYFDEGEE